MKLKQIFISLVILAGFLYMGLSDVSGNISYQPGKSRIANTTGRAIEQIEYKYIDGVCCMIIYDEDGGVTIVPTSKDFCD